MPPVLYDLYAGTGGIAFSLSGLAERVVCVEANPSAVADGRSNACLNAISNVDFVCSSVEDFLGSLRLPPSTFHLAVLDPPRCGLHPNALKALLRLAPERILYVSCNPQALARDLAALPSYRLERHTEHVEALALLAKE